MDPPDSTESILSLSFDSEIFGHEPNIQSEAHHDFLDDFFSGVQNENKESVGTDQLENNSKCNKKMESSPESPDPIPSVNEAMTEKLKQQNKELKEKMLKQEHELAKYEVELSEKMSCLLQVQMERDSLKENLEISDSQRSSLQLKLDEKEAELKQFKELVQKQVSEEEDIHNLKKQMSTDAKLLKKTERDLQRNTELLNKARENVRVLKRRNKKLISTLLEFGALLQQKELLSSKKKKFLEDVKRWVGELSETSMETLDTSSLSDEENEENNNLVGKTDTDLNTVNSSCKVNFNIKEEVNSPTSNDACLTSTTESFSNGFEHSIKSSPFFSVEDDGFVGSTKIHKYAPSPLAVGNKVIPHSHVTCKTENVASDKANRLSPDSNFQPFTPGTESQCSEDIEMTDDYFAEIKKGIKGWVLKSENFAPLSPLPPSPKESITVTHKKLFNKSEKYDNSKKCSPVSSVSDTSPELIPQEDIHVFQNSSNLKRETQISKNSDQSNSLCNVSSIKSQASTTSPEPNSETLSYKNELSQSSLLEETKDTGISSNNCLSTLSNIEQEISPQSPEPSPKPVEKKVFLPAHSSTLNEDEKMESMSSPLSPVFSVNKSISPTSPKLSSEILQDISQPSSATSASEKIDNHSVISSPERTSFNKTCSPEQSPVCFKSKNIFSHQNSKGFEPHINELNEKGNSVPNKSCETSVLSSEIPPELHYLSSTYSESNKVKILHQGNSVYDYLVNPDTKLSVCVLTVPSKSASSNQSDCRTLNACADSEKLLPNQEERKRRVLSVYRATERRLNLINRQILKANSPQENLNNSLNENSSHIYVVVENKNNDSLNSFGDNMTPQNVNDSGMDLECTASEDILMKDNSSENNKDLVDENQSFVSSSCDISTPSKRKLRSSSFKYHSDSQNNSSENLSSGQMENFNCKSETNLSVSEFTAKKKRLSHIDEKLPSKKQKTEVQLSTESERLKLSVTNSKKSLDFSSKTAKHSPLKSQVQLQNSVTTSSLSSDNNNYEKITSELQSKCQTLTISSVTQPAPKKSTSNISLSSTDVDNFKLLQKDSCKTSLFNSNNSLGEIKNSPEMPQLPLLTEDNLQIRLENALPENPPLSNLKLVSPSELKNSANDQSDINNPLLEIKNSPCEQSVSKLNNTLIEHENSPHQHLTEHNSPSKEIPSCILNEAQLSKSSSMNLTAFDCHSSNTPEKSESNSQSVSNIASPKVKHKKSLPKNKSKTDAKNSKQNKLSNTSKRSVSNIVSPKVKKSLPKNKSKTKAKNSKHDKLSEFVPEARDSPELKLPSCEPQSTISITPSELKGSTNDQPLSDTTNPLLEIKDSPSEQSVIKINNTQPVSNNTCLLEQINTPSEKSVSTFCNPELLSKNDESNQFISKEHSFPLDDLNSPSKNQTHSPMNNTPMKDTVESCTEHQMLDQTNLPSEIQIKSEINNVQFELKDINSPTNSYVPSVCSPLLYLEDNTLVIDEQISVEEDIIENDSKEDIIANIKVESQEVPMINGSDSECFGKTIEVDKVVKKSKKKNQKKKDKTSKSKKKKNKALLAKKKNLDSFKEEQSLCPILSIPRVLEQIDEVKILDSLNESHFKLHAHTLFSALINPSNASSTASVLFQIFNHLISSRTNPLMSFPYKYDSSVFFPLTERCIVLALMQAERKRKNHLKALKDAAINNLFLLILSKSSISKTGLGAFCRVFTELCKHSEERRKPVMLCCELIKANHKFAPILIASVMGVWPELFSYGGQVPEEEIILHASLAFGLQKKPSSLTSADWKQCKAVFSKYLLSSPVTDVEETTKNLCEILEDYLEDTPKENDYLLTDPLLIFAACKGWNWADEHLSSFILSSLAKYAQQKDSERAFSLFCNLYADISLLCPDFESSSEILEQLFTLEGAFEYVKGYAARSMIKLYLLSKHKFPPYLVEWTQENESKLIGTPTELLLKQCCLSDVSSFSENDIIAL